MIIAVRGNKHPATRYHCRNNFEDNDFVIVDNLLFLGVVFFFDFSSLSFFFFDGVGSLITVAFFDFAFDSFFFGCQQKQNHIKNQLIRPQSKLTNVQYKDVMPILKWLLLYAFVCKEI